MRRFDVIGCDPRLRGAHMRRREFITIAGGAAISWPLAARSQHAGKLPTIGFLGGSPSYWGRWVLAFVHRLRELGWTEGKTIAIEYRWVEGSSERMDEIASEFARLKGDLIVTSGTKPVAASMQATSGTPTVI